MIHQFCLNNGKRGRFFLNGSGSPGYLKLLRNPGCQTILQIPSFKKIHHLFYPGGKILVQKSHLFIRYFLPEIIDQVK
jgi:hypothetical protein